MVVPQPPMTTDWLCCLLGLPPMPPFGSEAVPSVLSDMLV